MDFEQLRTFLSVAEHRSFTKAAESMYISHSTTSRSVAALEERLGVRLLERDNRSVRLTAAGELLLREGGKLLEDVHTLENRVRSVGSGVQGTLSVASANIHSHALMAGYKDFCKAYPQLDFALHHRDINEICALVSSQSADVGVTFSFALPEEQSAFRVLHISRERFCLVVPAEHPLAARKSVSLNDLRCLPYLYTPALGLQYHPEEPETADFIRMLGDVISVPTIESLFLHLRSGRGISIMPHPVAVACGTGCAVLELTDLDASCFVDLFWRADNPNPRLPLLIQSIENHLHKM